MEKVYDVPDTAKRLRCCEATVYRILKSGLLKGNRVGNRWRTCETEILNFLRGGRGVVASGTDTRQTA